ncbi:MAG: DNA-binding protein [Eubacterium sp.]|nr:DNA-binding protein [Eubacterium sp.]
MEQKIEQAYLYDFYGELLKDRQRRIYEDFVFHDLSLGEIAREEGISRQGVHDLIRRCTKALEGYEKRLHLVQKFLDTKERVAKIHALAGVLRDSHDAAALDQIEQISNEILEEL